MIEGSACSERRPSHPAILVTETVGDAVPEQRPALSAVAELSSGEWRPMQVVLEPINGKGLKIPIDKAIIFIGRHPDCDIVITRSRTISRKHCAIVQVNDSLVLAIGSTNGVRVNGKRVKKEARFTAGDTVMFGDIEYNVRKIKVIEPEKRPNRDHHQDRRPAEPFRCVPKLPPPRTTARKCQFRSGMTNRSKGKSPPATRPIRWPRCRPIRCVARSAPDSHPLASPRKSPKVKGPGPSATHDEDDSIPLAD